MSEVASRRRPSGVTLLEILVAVAVLAIGLATVFQIFPMGFAAANQSKAKTIAYELAAQKVEDVRNNFLFGGYPSGSLFAYWGNSKAPNPDGTTYASVNTDGYFRAFSATATPEKNYFYRVQCIPVIDPAMKYLRENFYQTSAGGPTFSRGFATMWRVTVTVRGPLETVAEAQDTAWSQNYLLQKRAVEVLLTTYVANKMVGDAALAAKAVTGNTSLFVAGLDASGNFSSTAYPYPENFTVFEAGQLTLTERNDTGPTIMDYASGLPDATQMGLNRYGLDNVVIFSLNTTGPPSERGWVAESNKIVGIREPNAADRTDTNLQYWELQLLNPITAVDSDFPTRESTYSTRKLIDTAFNGAVRGSDSSSGYPIGARVRFLMQLDQTP